MLTLMFRPGKTISSFSFLDKTSIATSVSHDVKLLLIVNVNNLICGRKTGLGIFLDAAAKAGKSMSEFEWQMVLVIVK
jgi:hypothetical protein